MRKLLFMSLIIMATISLSANDFSFGAKKNPFSLNRSQYGGGSTVETGNMVFSGGIGSPNFRKATNDLYTDMFNFESSGLGPLHGKFEFFLNDQFGIGISINHVSSHLAYNDILGNDTISYTTDYKSTAFNMRFNYHFYNESGFDIYGGAGIGYRIGSYKFSSTDPFWSPTISWNNFPLGFELSTGIRYFFTDFIGIYAEVGLTKSIIQGGISIKI